MANEVVIQDPLGKPIHLLTKSFFTEIESAEDYDDAATVIKKPALIIEVIENNATHFYYFRSVGWNSTLLIAVRFTNGIWKAYNVVKNPSSQTLSDILKKGKQIY